MRLLIIGGTGFLGRHITNAALAERHRVTHFNRGLTNPEPIRGVDALRGDRDGDLGALQASSWDVVIDTCGYFPRQVAAIAQAVPNCRYVFVSSVNQYADFHQPDIAESHPSARLAAAESRLDPVTYGPLKAACERAAFAGFGMKALIVRPGYIVGPYDASHRFTYWCQRLAQGGSVLVPGMPDHPWQLIDARDIAGWIVAAAVAGRGGIFNLTGPANPSTAGGLLTQIHEAVGSDARLVWLDAAFLHAEPGGQRWLDLAHWAALDDDWRYLYSVSNDKAKSAGLTFRPLAETVADTLRWRAARPATEGPDAIDLAGEQRLLDRWGQGSPSDWSFSKLGKFC